MFWKKLLKFEIDSLNRIIDNKDKTISIMEETIKLNDEHIKLLIDKLEWQK